MSSLSLNLGTVTVTLGTGAASSTPAPSTGTTAPTTPTAPSPPAVVAVGTPIKSWNLQVGETVYRNGRDCIGPVGWSPWLVVCVFGDGNAVLVGFGNQVRTTQGLVVGYHIRRAPSVELYPDDTYPGP